MSLLRPADELVDALGPLVEGDPLAGHGVLLEREHRSPGVPDLDLCADVGGRKPRRAPDRDPAVSGERVAAGLRIAQDDVGDSLRVRGGEPEAIV